MSTIIKNVGKVIGAARGSCIFRGGSRSFSRKGKQTTVNATTGDECASKKRSEGEPAIRSNDKYQQDVKHSVGAASSTYQEYNTYYKTLEKKKHKNCREQLEFKVMQNP
ncbi:uncharacterized protein LOC119687830 isoform X1 [Teleopsis dalmanni]|uniref:uncharacterized protein LOC119687828 isoform X1 n=1 Tax=Teleopsis dalmanni TaxID=139649 RepID=UPI0018CFA837|nr:uncharacterized protein LOC119687828 isoform X1 [Teleopsis dalmanni]XP_037958269.1 uncharacterized protein LOC119687829 isoform X1 [Teleopsis dalmanni]XP_037958271.1 uncharacterized protein LOC119687830 isoform X1 [Teleopsis dalmanni]